MKFKIEIDTKDDIVMTNDITADIEKFLRSDVMKTTFKRDYYTIIAEVQK